MDPCTGSFPDSRGNKFVFTRNQIKQVNLVKGVCPDGAPVKGVCAEQEINDAWNAVSSAVSNLSSIQLSTSKDIVKAQQADDKARKDYIKAKDSFDSLSNLDPLELAKAEADAKLAKATYQDAQEKLQELESDVDNYELAELRAKLQYEETLLEDYSSQLIKTNLTAPFTGLIDTVSMVSGDRANQTSVFIEMVDTKLVEIHGSVDEVDVLSLAKGMPVMISMNSVPDRQFTGVIKRIGNAANGQNNVVTFPVEVEMTVPDGVVVREGLSATIDIVLEEYRNVLLVPTSAIYGDFLAPIVRVMKEEIIQEQPVRLGASDDFWVIIVQGLESGDMVVMPEPASANTQGSSFRSLTGSGRGGGSGNRRN